ncbi:hypothetical protein D9758_002623 [Tetrapyrgos nigripes]|uniref:Transcription and mRNA export factor SUS1 n=1 Tax=Tetrapyrgos nigripes TaxID=182062 RepID=A0A8H5LTG0_9AGAR|nr:hypothetical protein D9758_002623 [Tetrapyrgos nigripes]
MPVGAADVESFHKQIKRRAIENGDWERLRSSFLTKMAENGWLDEMMQKGKNVAQNMDNLRFEELRSSLSREVHKGIPLEIRREVLQSIRLYLDKQFD